MNNILTEHAVKPRKKQSLVPYMFVGPYMLLFLVFTVIPVAAAVVLSFTHFNVLSPPKFAGLTNYIRMFLDDDIFHIAVKNTLIIAFITGPIGYLICLFIAWLINDLKPFFRSLLTLLFYAPAISGAAFSVWNVILGGDQYGYLNNALIRLGLLNDPIVWLRDPKYILAVCIVVQLWMSLGTSFLAFIAGLQGIDKTLYEAGAMDGIKNRWQELWFITLPAMRPQLVFGAVMQITASFAVYQVCDALAGIPSVDYAAHTWIAHAQDVGAARMEMGYASSILTVLVFVAVAGNKFFQKLIGKVGE